MAFTMRDFRCTSCDLTFEAVVGDNEAPACPKCKDSEYIELVPTSAGGYKIRGDNSASVTPRGSGGWRRGSD